MFKRKPKYITGIQWGSPDSDDLIVHIVKRRRLWGLLPLKDISYRGNGTVWHEYGTGVRPSVLMEDYLSNLWKKEKRKREREAQDAQPQKSTS